MNQFSIINHNQGIVLFIALVFMFVSTLLGVSALRANLFNEKMTYSNMQREKALEAAEVGLLEGEEFVEAFADQIAVAVIEGAGADRLPTNDAKKCEVVINGQAGVCVRKEQADPEDYDNWVDYEGESKSLEVWNRADRHRRLSDLIKNKYDLNTAPKYIVEFLGFVVGSDGTSGCETINPSNPNPRAVELDYWPYCSLDNTQFRITARATVGNYDETRVMLQTTYVVSVE